MSHAVPVFQGFAIPNSIRRIDVAGRDVTEHLQQLLRKNGRVFHTSAEKETVKNIKETTGYVALDPAKEEKDWSGSSRSEGKSIDYVLPDGQKLKVRRICATLKSELTKTRLAQNVSERRRYSSILRSSVWSTLVCIKLWWKRYIEPTWISARRCTVTLCCLEAPP